MSRLRRWLAAVAPALGLLLLAELTLRGLHIDFAQRSLEVERRGTRHVPAFASHLDSAHFTPDPRLFWRPRAGRAPFNALGYRGPELSPAKPAREFRVLAVGDSNMLGHADTWVDELPARLEWPATVGATRVVTLNAAAYGYTAYQGRLRLREFLSYAPDVVLIGFGGNDPTLNVVSDAEYGRRLQPPWAGRLRLLAVLQHLALRLAARRGPTPAAALVPRVPLDEYRRHLHAMLAEARAAGALPVLLTRPLAHDYRRAEAADPAGPYLLATLDVAREAGAGAIDVDALANHVWTLFDDHAHFNRRGHRWVGARVARALDGLLRGKPVPLEELRYEPQEGYERAASRARAVLDPRRSLAANLALLYRQTQAPRPSAAALQAEPADAPHHWIAPEGPTGTPECFSTYPGNPARLEASWPPASPRLRLVWVQVRRAGPFGLRFFWDTGRGFGEDGTVSAPFVRPGAPEAATHVLPPEARRLRVEFYPAAGEPVRLCLERFVLLELEEAPAP